MTCAIAIAVCAASRPRLCLGSRQRSARLLLILQQQHLMDDGHLVFHLDLHQRAAHRLADVGRVHCFPAQNHPEANDGGERRAECRVIRAA